MASTSHPALFPPTAADARTFPVADTATGLPWYLWTSVAALTSAWVGGSWDVAWHRSIGRDSFWTPAHLMVQLCAVLAGIVGVWLVSRATWGRTAKDARLRAASVSLLGLHAPLGVFMAGWGGVAMLTSAPFDNWWHSAYGLDVTIISPPHVLLLLGVRAVSIGILFLILAEMNRAQAGGARNFPKLQTVFLYVGGLIVLGQMFFLQELTWDVFLHGAGAYIGIAIAVPVVLAAMAQTSYFRWTATTLAGLYVVLTIAEILILPLFPAQPKLGPVYYPVTHLVPTKFPILLVLPALALDLFWQRTKRLKSWQIAAVSGVLFVAVLVAFEWPFADFLMTKHAANRFFGTIYFDYGTAPNDEDLRRIFWHPQSGWPLVRGLSIATACAMLSTWFGLVFGRWARTVQR